MTSFNGMAAQIYNLFHDPAKMIQLLFANEYQNAVNYRRIDRRQTKKNCHSKSAIGAGAKVTSISWKLLEIGKLL